MALKSALAAVPARVLRGAGTEVRAVNRKTSGAVLFLYYCPQCIHHPRPDRSAVPGSDVCYRLGLGEPRVIFSWIHLSPAASPARRVC